MIWNFFDTALVLNLDRRTDRWSQAQDEAAFLDIPVRRYTSVSRVDGADGCRETHQNAWRSVARGEYGERVLVFEDDFQLLLPEHFLAAGIHAGHPARRMFSEPDIPLTNAAAWARVRFETMVQGLPDDWELLYLGGNYAWPPFRRVSTHVLKHAGMTQLHAYAIHRSAAEGLLEIASSIPKGWPIDEITCRLALTHRFYSLSPRMFIQRPSKSDTDPNPHSTIGGFPWSMVDPTYETMV